jgi:hypothetical protein
MARKYRDRKPIDGRLPKGYKKAPTNAKNCGNCIFYKAGGQCQFWRGAKVRPSYLCAKWVDKSEKILKFAPNQEKPQEEVEFSTRTSGGHYRIGERKRRNFKLLSERRKRNVQLNRQRRQQYSNQNNDNNNTPPPTQTNRSSGGGY